MFVQTVGDIGVEEPDDDDGADVERESVRAGDRGRVHGHRGRVSSTMPTGRILVMVNGQVVADQAVTPVSGSTARVTSLCPALRTARTS